MAVYHQPIDIDGFSGEVVTAEHPEYDQSRQLWNAMFDRRPLAITRCFSPADVAAALAYARRYGLALAVRCGGHSLPGHSVCDGGVVIDLAPMRAVTVDPIRRRARVQGGSLLGPVDQATQAYGLGVPMGFISHTGVGGLVLGGGVGHLMRRHGLSVDSLLSAEVVTADGSLVRASAEEHPELFWGLRGGGGNFGVVTEFEFQLHDVGPILTSTAVFALERARHALQRWRMTMTDAPDELQWETFFFRPAFGIPWLPDDLVGKPALIMDLHWIGDAVEGERVISPILDALGADAQVLRTVSLIALQTAYDEMFRHGQMSHHKSGFFQQIPDRALDILVERAAAMESLDTYIDVLPLGGALARVAPDATAFPHRNAGWIFNLMGMWNRPHDAERNIAWVRNSYRLLEPHLIEGTYVNNMGSEEPGGHRAAYGRALARLRQVKALYDPENVFRGNHNITPAR